MVAGCSLLGTDADGEADTVVLLTHDSFSLPQELFDAFEESTGIRIDHRAQGDAGSLTTSVVLTKDDPLGDVVFGIDNTFASRAIDASVFTDFEAAVAVPEEFRYPGSAALTPIDYGDVCINIDTRFFAENDIAEPETLDDLLSENHRDLTVVQNPATSSPGLAFLLATVETFGDGWQDYWTALRDNGVRVADGWTQAYYGDFSGTDGDGNRPIVVSYASSPPAEAGEDGTPPPTRALDATCFRQIEYAGVLAGTEKPAEAGQVIDFLLSPEVQEAFPDNMYVFPVVEGTPLPDAYEKYAPAPANPITMSPERIGDNRDQWISEWRSLVLG
ncbi:thiamine ABC transporter substrate-binding protein [Hoyosella rhizosphaerae]|nr:thiamine ABC transporter substrate-binding protein [Hoyosella rhizosphaerae]